MSARRHGQGGHLAPIPAGTLVKFFCALGVIVKRSVDQLFMHYFHNFCQHPIFHWVGEIWKARVVHLVLLACVLRATTKKGQL